MWPVVLICLGIVLDHVQFGNARDFAVRLNNIHGIDSAEGRLEIFYNGSWGTVCDDYFTNASARVACASLGFGSNGTVIHNRHGAGAGPIWLSGVNCTGSENGIEECVHDGWSVHNCCHSDDVAISCDNTPEFSVRLNNSFSSNSGQGRLEIYYSGRWGTVCDLGFTDDSARVACVSLGFQFFGGTGTLIRNRHEAGTGPVWLDGVNCRGTERGIEQCVHNEWGVHNCSHYDDVSISCDCETQDFSEPTGTIISWPNLRLRYTINCYNYNIVSSGQTVLITFQQINERYYSNREVEITCEGGNDSRSARFGLTVSPPVLTISSCKLITVNFHSMHWLFGMPVFSLTYTTTTDIFIGGITKRPQNAFPRSDNNDSIIFNCTTASKTLPWWTINKKAGPQKDRFGTYTITNSACRVNTSEFYKNWFMTESLGPGSCNLIVVAPTNKLHLLEGSMICTDATLTSAKAILQPIDCNSKNFSGPTGHISSPYYPLEYANYLDCYNYISVSSGQTVIITFLAFDLGTTNYDWLSIICESWNNSRSAIFTGSQIPPVLSMSFCNLITVYFHSDIDYTWTGFSLVYNTTTDTAIGGIKTRPSNAFPRSRKYNPVVLNCTTASKALPWWTISYGRFRNYTLTNSTCEVIKFQYHDIRPTSSFFTTETLGSGSCNLIVAAPDNLSWYQAVSLFCTDATLSSAGAILQPINLELTSNSSTNSTTTVMRDEEMTISCNPFFISMTYPRPLDFTYFLYSGGPFVQMRILKTYWTLEGIVVSSIETSNTSSYVVVKVPKDGVIPRYTCNIVVDFFSNISGITANPTIELSFSTDPMEVLYWPTEDDMKIIGHDNGKIQNPTFLNCSAAANPPSNYTWIDESNGITINGPTIFITHDGKYTCKATSVIAGKKYQQSRSLNLQIVENEKPQNSQVFVLLGVGVVAVIILISILLSRTCRQQAINPGNDKEYELPQRGGEGDLYEAGLGTDTNVLEAEYDQPDDLQRRLSNTSAVYDEIEDHDNGHELLQSVENTLYATGSANYIDIIE